ncbi:MAG: hypothetical protein ABUR63_09560 [Verrucomicrobiota bacterium]
MSGTIVHGESTSPWFYPLLLCWIWEYETTRRFDVRGAPGKSWWWVCDDEYRITFSNMQDYKEVARYPFRGWLPRRADRILVIRRRSPLP